MPADFRVVVLPGGWLRRESGSILAPGLLHAALNVTVCLSVALRSAR